MNCRGLSPLSLILIPNAYSVKVTRSHAANMSAKIDVLQKDMARPKEVGLDAITMDGDMVTPYSGKLCHKAVGLPKRREALRFDNFSH